MVNKLKIINRLIFTLSLIGVFISLYLLYNYLTESPLICLNSGCETVRKSDFSQLLSIPIPIFGIIGFLIITLLSFVMTININSKILTTLLLISFGGFLFVSYLTYLEVFIIHAICSWCALTAAIMVLIFSLSFFSYIRFKKYAIKN